MIHNIAKRLFQGGGTILDIGCSDGSFLDYFDNSYIKYGIELDSKSCLKAVEKGISILGSDISDLVSNNIDLKFDCIIFRGTLEHFFDPFTTFKIASSFLKKTGRIILLMTPNADAPVLKIFEENWAMFNPIEHLWFFNEKTLNMINENMIIERIDYPYLGTPYEDLKNDIQRVAHKLNTTSKDNNVLQAPAFFNNVLNCVIRFKNFKNKRIE